MARETKADLEDEIALLKRKIADLEIKVEDLTDENERLGEEYTYLERQYLDTPDFPGDVDLIIQDVEWEKTQRALGKPIDVAVLFDAFDKVVAGAKR